MYCVKCGCKLEEDANFCCECGTPVTEQKIMVGENEGDLEILINIYQNKKKNVTKIIQNNYIELQNIYKDLIIFLQNMEKDLCSKNNELMKEECYLVQFPESEDINSDKSDRIQYCSNCGAFVGNAKYCEKCGTNIRGN